VFWGEGIKRHLRGFACVKSGFWVVILVFFNLANVLPATAEKPDICLQYRVKMPSVEHHKRWLEKNERYGARDAESFMKRVGSSGNDYLQHQVFYFPEHPGASGWFDINGLTGLREAKAGSVIKRGSCKDGREYPLLFLVGIIPEAVEKGRLFVSNGKDVVTELSLRRLQDEREPIQMIISKSGVVACPNLRLAEWESEVEACPGLVATFSRLGDKPKASKRR
jgi:hypothetical protein